MKSESEIKDKLRYYEGMLTGVEVGKKIDKADVFLEFSKYFPDAAMHMLKTSADLEKVVQNSPSEDQRWMGEWFSNLGSYARHISEARAEILRWVLSTEEEEKG